MYTSLEAYLTIKKVCEVKKRCIVFASEAVSYGSVFSLSLYGAVHVFIA